ncbi:MAG: putative N-acetylmuramoyl-L-alanine amidase [Pseudonocardiales bacterium]|nr:putative N-acetylmuramoyl-L-alanine amidase [Pseudonocardiales bacterium]
MQDLRRGATGSAVAEVRRMLASLGLLDNTNPEFGDVFDEITELAVRHFQQRRGISVDGAVGAETYAALTGAHWRLGDRVLSHDAAQLMIGDDVSALQQQLLELGYNLVRADGVFGATTAEGTRAFQRDYGLVPDGICGPATLHALRQLGRRVVGGRPQLLREMVAVAASGPSLLGKRIVLDPGHGGDDRGIVHDGIEEAALVWDLATRLEGRLTALGVRSWLTRGPSNAATDEQRATLANEVGADLVLSLHVDGFASPRANGVAAYYYGGGETSSTIGERLADLVQRELVARTGLLNGRIHGKSWALLRLTRMPTVRVELGYLTSPIDRPRLVDPLFRDTVAEGLLVAVQRLYLPLADDPPTGVMRIPAIAG